MKYSEQRQLVSDLRALADFYEHPAAIELPAPDLRFSNFVSNGGKWNSETQEYEYNVEETQAKMKRQLRALKAASGSVVKKDYSDYALVLSITIGFDARVKVQAQRNAICTRKQVGEKLQEAYYSPSKVVPVYEYECEPSLINID